MRWMLHAITLCATVTLLSPICVRGDEAAPAEAASAKAKYDQAAKKAKREYDQVMAVAKRQYVAELDEALKRAMKAGHLDAANSIADLKRQLESQLKAPAAGDAVDLMALIDVKRDAVEGAWRLENGVLSTDGKSNARLMIPYEPPAQYDFTLEYRRVSGQDQIGEVFPVSGGQLLWSVGAWGKKLALSSAAKELTTSDDATLVADGAVCISTLQVRRDVVRIVINDKVVAETKVDPKQKVPAAWALPSTNAFGVGSWFGVNAEFRRIELKEIEGHGRFVPPPARAADK